MDLNEDFIIGHEAPFARALVDKLGLVKALAYVGGVAGLIRADAEQEHRELTAALGQPETPARRNRKVATKTAPPATQEELVQMVRAELKKQERSPRGLAALTGASSEQIAQAPETLGARKLGRKYALKAGA